MAKISFQGPQKLIVVEAGVTQLSIQQEVYPAWKDWVSNIDNSKYLPAFSTIGGNPLPGSRLGITFLLENGWKIRPYEGDHRLSIEGNLYSADGTDPIADTLGDYKVTVSLMVSNLVNTVGGGSSVIGDIEIDAETLNGLSSQEEWTIVSN